MLDVNSLSGFHFLTFLILFLFVVSKRRTHSGSFFIHLFFEKGFVLPECSICSKLVCTVGTEEWSGAADIFGTDTLFRKIFRENSFLNFYCLPTSPEQITQTGGRSGHKSLTHNWCPFCLLLENSGPCWVLEAYISFLSTFFRLIPKFTDLADILFSLW